MTFPIHISNVIEIKTKMCIYNIQNTSMKYGTYGKYGALE